MAEQQPPSVDDLVVQAGALHAQGRLGEARELLARAREMDAARADVHFNLGLYCGEAGDPAGAAACFAEAVRLRPDWVDGHIYLVANTLQAGDVARALELLDAAFRVAPDNPSLHEQLAIATERKLAQAQAGGHVVELEQALGYLQSAAGNLKAVALEPPIDGDPARARRYIEMLSRVRGAVELAEASLAREHGMAFNRARGAPGDERFPGFIVLSTMPKSGSEYVWSALTTGLNLKPTRISSAQMYEVIDGERLAAVAQGGFVTHGHMHCTPTNNVLLSQHVDRLVVHVRDPRQALVSWVHYQDHRDIQGLPTREGWGNMADMSFDARVDYFIEGFFAHQVQFLQSWMDAEADREFSPRILVTRQEDLRVAPREFFTRILEFHGLDPALFRFPEPPKEGERHFRRGEADEWRKALRPAQIERMQAMLPDRILERYGWQR